MNFHDLFNFSSQHPTKTQHYVEPNAATCMCSAYLELLEFKHAHIAWRGKADLTIRKGTFFQPRSTHLLTVNIHVVEIHLFVYSFPSG